MDYSNYMPVIRNSTLFNGLNPDEINLALESMNAWVKKYRKGEIILRFSENINHASIVLHGETRCSLFEPIDHPLEVIHGTVGEVFMLPGSCKMGFKSPIELRAYKDTEIMFLDIKAFLNRNMDNNENWHIRVTSNLIDALADHSIALNFRLRVIAHKKVRDRILIYLNALPTNDKGIKHIPMGMTDFSKFIHVEKSAMYKNIKEMEEEGILEWDRRQVRLLIDNKGL